ncbi:L-aspartate oxidase [Candidatus Endomicrobiellum trichonymphae]|uniref:L-aspartate oxidase n=1 Tax=Endomicrobium trichonymphae TaxID=1408204 RepID=B1GZK0_ENDTX|nr:L-aspartate oxidase [Candidatus Endomicrobium trichonymphae]BAG13682.1 L-aspartate oxidase [Candidatus Endomicrobium trichonymphae]
MISSDYLVIGSGIAGLSLALKASKNGSVSLITKKKLFDSATGKAQGGIACVMDESDSFEAHVRDTIVSGAGLCNEKMVEKMVVEGPERIRELIVLGVEFTKKKDSDSKFELALEGGHGKRRILHAGDITGNEIERVLIRNIEKHKNITVYEYHTAIDLILNKDRICRGVYVFDSENNNTEIFEAKVTALTCGGAGKTYLYTSNPDVATGDAVAMAYRAGADIANMEFVQFHPTCLHSSDARSFLISEAVRGEGAVLKLKDGGSFVEKYNPQKELASRDVVARAIDCELKSSGEKFVYLDITAKSKDFLMKRFPNIYAKCLEYGIDISRDMIPVVPAAHFFCGGVVIDENGRSSIKNLYAAGETACSGVHGANRLASNSLLEGVVYADRIYKDSLQFLRKEYSKIDGKPIGNIKSSLNKSAVFVQKKEEVRRLTWDYLGISRSNEGLLKAQEKIDVLKVEIEQCFKKAPFTIDGIEVRNMMFIAEMIARSAIQRKESRGLHFNTDYLFLLPDVKDTVINIR